MKKGSNRYSSNPLHKGNTNFEKTGKMLTYAFYILDIMLFLTLFINLKNFML